MQDRFSQMGLICGGTIWAKWPKTASKLKNQHFGGGKTVGEGHGGISQFFEKWGDSPSSPLSLSLQIDVFLFKLKSILEVDFLSLGQYPHEKINRCLTDI